MFEFLRDLSMYVCFIFMIKHKVFEQIHTRWRLDFTQKSESVCMYVWDIHTYMLSCLRHTYIHAQLPGTYIHTYMLRRPQTYIHTCLGLSDVHTYMLRVGLELKHTYMHVWSLARLPEVPLLTIQKKMNRNAPGEPFPVCFWTLTFLWKFWDIHTYIHVWEVKHTYIHTRLHPI